MEKKKRKKIGMQDIQNSGEDVHYYLAIVLLK